MTRDRGIRYFTAGGLSGVGHAGFVLFVQLSSGNGYTRMTHIA